MYFALQENISPIHRNFYWFEVDFKFQIVLKEFVQSRRDDENDIWGDEWQAHYIDDKFDIEDKIEQIKDQCGLPWDESQYYNEEISNLREKMKQYNPWIINTIHGERRLTGTTKCGDIVLPWKKEEIIEIITKEFTQKIKENNA